MAGLEPRRDPRVSVVMTAYGDLRFIEAAARSILNQTYADFELIIVDDGTRQSDIFARLQSLDERIRIIAIVQNIGAYAAANLGIASARGEIIARIDADDLAEPTRLARLASALDSNRDLDLVGSWARHISEDGELLHVWETPVTDIVVRWNILFANPFCHSSVAFRRAAFDTVGGYNSTMRQSGDYELWWRLLEVGRAGNLPEPLVRYRRNSLGLTAGNSSNWRERTDHLRRHSWERLGVDYKPQLVPHLAEFMLDRRISNRKARPQAYRIMLMLLARFLASHADSSDSDRRSARRLATEIVGLILEDADLRPLQRVWLWPLCWNVDRATTIAALKRWASKRVPSDERTRA